MTIADPRLAGADIRLPELESPFAWRRREGAVWVEAALPGATAAFSSRLGGASSGAYWSLNLGILTEDDAGVVARNRVVLAGALGRDPEMVAMGFQVHGTDVQVHREAPEVGYAHRGELPKADAQATGSADVTPLVLVADCVPLALSAPGAAAAVHCGWRGVSGGIVERAVETVVELAAVERSRLAAALGPGIGPCCYEVGETVRDAFRARGHDHAPRARTFDLAQAIRIELERAGVEAGAIAASGLCTSCNPALFFSHRRDGGVTGRQAGLVWLNA